MTISSTTRRAGPFAGNGVSTTFPFAFKVFAKSDIALTLTDANGTVTELVLDSDYSVTLNASQETTPGGSIAYPVNGAPLSTGATLIVIGDLPYTQPTDITNNGGFYPSVIEDMSDRSTIQIQQLAELGARTLHFPVTETTIDGEFPAVGQRADTVFGFDASGNPTYLPIPAAVGAGDMRFDTFISDALPNPLGLPTFTAGVTTSLTLSRAPINKANCWAYWDATEQLDFTVIGTALGFPAAILVGVSYVNVRTGTTLSLNTPAQNSVTDATVARPSKLYCRINDEVHVTDPGYGVVGDGINDDTAGLIAAYNSGAKYVYTPRPPVAYRTTAPITIPATCTVKIQGDSTTPYYLTGPFPGNRGPGTWFFLDHPGIGFDVGDPTGAAFMTGFEMRGVGTYRNHANTVQAGWTPTVFDYDIRLNNVGFVLDDVCLLNAYNGVSVPNNYGARGFINNMFGQWMNSGISIANAQDVIRINNIHNWPFWANVAPVTSYQLGHTTVIAMQRADVPMVSNVFSIYANIVLGFYQGAAGKTSRIMLSNISADQCNYPLYVDAGVTGMTGRVSNLNSYGPGAPSAAGQGIAILGTNCQLDFSGLQGSFLSNSFLTVSGTNNKIRVNQLAVDGWGAFNNTAPMINIFAGGGGNEVRVADKMNLAGDIGPYSSTVVAAAVGTVFTNPQGITAGTAEILAGSTTVVVNHGLPIPPVSSQIKLDLASGIGAAKAVFKSNITATTFQINLDVAPGAPVFIDYRCALE